VLTISIDTHARSLGRRMGTFNIGLCRCGDDTCTILVLHVWSTATCKGNSNACMSWEIIVQR
jgi:hypothetical protein